MPVSNFVERETKGKKSAGLDFCKGRVLKSWLGNFPGNPVVKTSPSSAGSAGLIPDGRAKIPHASQPKNHKVTLNRINTTTNSIKAFKKWSTSKKFSKKKKMLIATYFLVSASGGTGNKIDFLISVEHSRISDLINCTLVIKGFPGGSVKNLPAMQETWVRSLGLEEPLGKEM